MLSKIKSAIKELNPAQREAVEQIDGPVLVLAGPGTGKTQLVATRIAKILQETDTPPSAVLALTFTEAGVRAMRLRLLELVGPLAYQVGIYTFHGFASDLIRQNPESFTIGPDPQPLTDLERFQLIEEILEKNDFRLLRPINAPTYYLRAILETIQGLKREGVSPTDLKELVKAEQEKLMELKEKQKRGEKVGKTILSEQVKQVDKLTDLVEIYYFYQKAVLDLGRFDFEDMINFANLALIKDETLLLALQERFQYFLVDEFQDTNSSQLNLLKQLTSFWGQRANLFVVGDPNQSIYRFQGASFENILEFLDEFPKAKTVSLVDNYRSGQAILDAAYQLISFNEPPKSKLLAKQTRLEAVKKKTAKLQRAQFTNGLVEQYYLGKQIAALISDGVPPGEIAIIYKRNQTADELVPILNHFKIPYQVAGGGNLLTDPQLRQLIRLLRLLASLPDAREDGVSMFEFFSLPFLELDLVDVFKLNRAAAKSRLSFVDFLSRQSLKKLELNDPEKILNTQRKLSEWSVLAKQLSVPELIERVTFESGFLADLETRPDTLQKMTRLKSFLDFVANLHLTDPDLQLSGLLNQLDTLEINNLGIPEPEWGLADGLVTLTTAHKTKGLEWDHCFVYKMIDGEWGNPNVRQLIKLPEGILKFTKLTNRQAQNEEERRLFYVALTRARKTITLTHSSFYQSGSTKETVPSLFLAELPPLAELETKATTNEAIKSLRTILAPAKEVAKSREKELLQSVIDEGLQLSATAITTYLDCAYKFKLKYLIKIPEAQATVLIYGSAVHRSLELFYRQLQKTGVAPQLDELLSIYLAVLETQPLPDGEKKQRRKQGQQILTAYYLQHQNEFPKPLFVERWFGGRYKPIFFGKIPLTGKIDRIDLINPETKAVRIIDYKTGRPRSLNEVMGQTAAGDTSQLTQLLFYKLVADLDKTFDYTVSELQLDFVEGPHHFKTFKRPFISASQEQMETLKQTIKTVHQKIKDLKFGRTTDYRICESCPFQYHCWPDGIPAARPEQLPLI